MAERTLGVKFLGDDADLRRAFKRSGEAAEGFGTKVARFGKLAAVAGGVGLGVLAVGLKKSVMAASDLTEQVNKANVVFGKSGKEVASWSKGLASGFGLSSRAALEAAGTFGNMLVPMGFARTEAAGMSKRMVELAGDMASFNNASPVDTLDALRAGLAGESEPLRRFGVFLSDARLKQEALSLGLYDGKGALDASAKAAATYAVILKDTKDTQGDFARTSDSVANAQRTISAEVENLSAKVGMVLLPALGRVLAWTSDQLPKISAFFDEHSGTIKRVLGAVGTVISTVVVPTFNRLKEVGLVVIGAVSKIIRENGPEIERIFHRVQAAVSAVSTVMLFLADKVVIPILKPLFMTVLPTILGLTITVIDKLSAAIAGVIKGVEWLGKNAAKIFLAMKGALEKPLAALASALDVVASVLGRIKDAMNWIIDHVGDLVGGIGKVLGAVGGIAGHLPGFAAGGAVEKGRAVVVGEDGPEVFIPGANGQIVSNNASAAGASAAGGMGDITIHVYGSVLTADELTETVRRGLYRFASRNPGALPGVA